MAKVPLRVYNHDIEKLIENRHTQEAVAHCKQILKFYPKHIDTYRLLGKAFLESQRYSEASDILQRVLSVVPDDFISQLGMSIIREDEGDLDGAIYHMERAFEVQPANTAIQEELRRLYGNRDGIQPPKIRLTRGALVRMYGRGELFTQAIAEATAAMVEDPQRVDMQVLLGRLYYQSGQKVKATEVCSQLVDKLPYCYEANRILADVLPDTSRPEDAQVYLERLRALDPYLAFVSETQPNSTDVSDNAVMVDQLEYDPEQDEPAQPGWTQQVGLAWDNAASAEEKPDWMAGEQPADENPSILPAQLEEEAPAQAADIPDWMAAAGWKPSSGDEVETHLTLDDTSEDLVAPADMPDWLQDLAPQPEVEPEAAPADVEEDSQWLDQILSPGMPSEPQIEPPVSEEMPDASTVADADVPDWLKDLESPVAQETVIAQSETGALDWMTPESDELSEGGLVETNDTAVPEWLQDLSANPAEATEDSVAGEMPEWLQEAQSSTEISGEPHAVEADQLPDWLQDITQQPTAEIEQAVTEDRAAELEITEATDVETPSITTPEMELSSLEDHQSQPIAPPDDMDAALAWLESLAAKQGADEATLTTQPDERGAEMPEWLQREAQSVQASEDTPQAALDAESAAEIAEETPSSVDLVPDWLQESTETESSEIDTDVPAWLAEKPAGAEANIPEGSALPEIPEWLQEQPGIDIPQTAEDALPADVPEWLQDTPVSEVVPTPEDALQAEVPEWLQEQPAVENTQESGATADAEIPEWEQESPAVETSDEPVEAAVPEWLQELSAETDTISGDSTAEGADLPEWMDIPTAELTQTTESAFESVDLPEWLQENAEEIESLDNTNNRLSSEPLAEEPSVVAQISEITAETSTPPVQPGDDIDAALAWLESLAAKQGADEETLITRPEDRVETAPEWVQKAEADAANIVETSADMQEIVELPLAAEAEMEITEELVGEIATSDIKEAVELTEAVPTVSETTVEPEIEAVALEIEETVDLPAVEVEEAAVDEPADQEQPEITAWMADEEAPVEKTQPVRAATVEEMPVQPVETTGQDEEEDDTLPEWLRDLGSYSTDIETGETQTEETMTEWLPEAEFEPTAVAQASPVEQVQSSAEQAVEPEPVMDVTNEQVNEVLPEPPTAVVEETPEQPEDTQPVVTVSAPVSGETPERLQTAQTALNKGDIETALSDYDKFIQNGELIEETIHDLRDALYRFPMDTNIWQSLGDAYMRSNRIQEALDAYTKAEELLR